MYFQRDPRQHTVSAFYFVDVDNTQELKAGDDASHAEFFKIEELEKLQDKFAFDHKLLFKDLLDFKSKL
jgi:ADP-ribose pyrophosphatase YjhB (NUDIX family)